MISLFKKSSRLLISLMLLISYSIYAPTTINAVSMVVNTDSSRAGNWDINTISTFGIFRGLAEEPSDRFNDVRVPYVTETEVTLTGGLLSITDVNGGTSDDDLTISY